MKRACSNCKHKNCPINKKPCRSCTAHFTNWEEAEAEDGAPVPQNYTVVFNNGHSVTVSADGYDIVTEILSWSEEERRLVFERNNETVARFKYNQVMGVILNE